MKAYLVRGVPRSLQQDGWWLNPVAEPQVPQVPERPSRTPVRWTMLALIALITFSGALVGGVQPPQTEWGFPSADARRSLGAPITEGADL